MSPLPIDPISISAAASLLRVHTSAVHRWVHAGRVGAWKVGGRWVLSRAEILAVPRRTGPALPQSAVPPGAAPSHAEAVAVLRASGFAE